MEPDSLLIKTESPSDSSAEESEATKNDPRSKYKHVCEFEGCNQKFRRLTYLDRHTYKFHSKEKQYACTYVGCDKRYIITTHLRRHIQTFHERNIIEQGPRIQCPVEGCNRNFNTNTNVRRHVRNVHVDKKIYTCKICNYISHHQTQFFRHMECHVQKIDPKRYTCDYCDEFFAQWSRLQRHRKEMHPPTCELCGRTFTQQKNLKTHMKDHMEQVDDFKCVHDDCNRSYKHKRNLDAHVRVAHKGEKFICPVAGCTKDFTSKRRRQDHIELHDKSDLVIERKEPAERCDKGQSKIPSIAILSGIQIKAEANRKRTNKNADNIEVICSDFVVTSDSDGENIIAPKNMRICIPPIQTELLH